MIGRQLVSLEGYLFYEWWQTYFWILKRIKNWIKKIFLRNDVSVNYLKEMMCHSIPSSWIHVIKSIFIGWFFSDTFDETLKRSLSIFDFFCILDLCLFECSQLDICILAFLVQFGAEAREILSNKPIEWTWFLCVSKRVLAQALTFCQQICTRVYSCP